MLPCAMTYRFLESHSKSAYGIFLHSRKDCHQSLLQYIYHHCRWRRTWNCNVRFYDMICSKLQRTTSAPKITPLEGWNYALRSHTVPAIINDYGLNTIAASYRSFLDYECQVGCIVKHLPKSLKSLQNYCLSITNFSSGNQAWFTVGLWLLDCRCLNRDRVCPSTRRKSTLCCSASFLSNI